ncbi:MAG: hypothetical protein AAGG75_18285 [Bacteroidota bacterium]
MQKNKSFQGLLLLLQIATVAVFAGRAWQHLYWDAPYRALLWDEAWMSGIVEQVLGLEWSEYITSERTDRMIQHSIRLTGGLYALCALVAAFARRLPRYCLHLLPLGTLGLTFLAALYCKEKFFALGQFFEYSLQIVTPLLFYDLFRRQSLGRYTIRIIKIAIVLTFCCHGLYAINYYPRPGYFVGMTINILGVEEGTAHQFLWWAGFMDFLGSFLLLVLPHRRLRPVLWYLIIWGLGTTLARVWAHFYWDFVGDSLLQWLHESVMRGPHFLVPLGLYVYLFSGRLWKG